MCVCVRERVGGGRQGGGGCSAGQNEKAVRADNAVSFVDSRRFDERVVEACFYDLDVLIQSTIIMTITTK